MALRCAELYLRPEDEASPAQPPVTAESLRLDAPMESLLGTLFEHVDVVLAQCDAVTGATLLRQAKVPLDLVYIDPPYASHRDYLYAQRHPEDGSRVERVAFRDRWDGGMLEYVDSLTPVFEAVHAALSDEGSFLLHVDPRGAPYLSIRCDELFGLGERLSAKNAPGFRNEIIWTYGLGGSSPRSWPKKHDNILWYTKGSDWFFDPPMTPAKSNRMRGQLKKQPDVVEIPSINNMAKDRTGYPTQKPLELLEMLVKAHTRERSFVADFFSGSGTTALAAARNQRHAFASDIADDAIAVARNRLLAEGASVAILRPGKVSGDDAAAPKTLDETALVFSRLGTVQDRCFLALEGGEPTHRLVRDVYGHETIQKLSVV